MDKFRRLQQFLRQPDVRSNPLKALGRRVRWRWHWRLHPGELLLVKDWYNGLQLFLPQSGCAAQVYNRRYSSPEVVDWMGRLLKPGMTFVDVGAHIGEYSLIAAALVSQLGRVHAIEPQPDMAELIGKNAVLNQLSWVTVQCSAVANRAGKAQFTRDVRGKGGWLSDSVAGEKFEVDVVTLEEICVGLDWPRLDFIKLDAAGNELAAVQGGTRLLTAAAAPTLLVKFYHPQVVQERFGVDNSELRRLLEQWGYRLFRFSGRGLQAFDGEVAGYGIAVLASKDPAVLKSAHVG